MTYSGLIAFISGLVSVSFGLIFTLTVTRRLLPEEYGTLGLLLSIVNYLLISEVIISFWSTRQIARNENIGKSSIFSSLLLSIFILPLFLGYIFLISNNSQAEFNILLLGIFLIPLHFFSQSLTAINMGHKPHVTSYTQIVFQIIKIPIALITVFLFDLSILGVILAIAIAFIGKISVQLYYSKNKLNNKFSFQQLKRWIKLSWIPLFGHLQNYLQLADIALYSLITGSVIGIAFYNAAFAIGTIVSQSGSLTQALYPKLLANKTFDGMAKNLDHVLYFGILMTGISIIFSKPAIFALNPLYQDAWPIAIVISLKLFLQALRTIPVYITSGVEQIDTENNPKFSQLIKSNLFKIPKFLAIFNFSYLIILVALLLSFKNSDLQELDLVFWWSIIGLVIEIPISAFLWIYSRRYVKLSLPIKSLLKYMAGLSASFAFFYFTSDLILNYDKSIYNFLPTLLLELTLCIGVYIGITYLINKETRQLLKLIFSEIKKFSIK